VDPPVELLWDIVEEHLDEAEFGVGETERMFESPVQTLADLPGFGEGRFVAHVDGLVIAGEAALERVVLPALESAESPERVTAAALVLLEMAAVERLLPALGHADAGVRRAVARACVLGMRGEACARYASEHFRGSKSPSERAGLLEVMAELGVGSPAVLSLLGSDEPGVVAASARVARFCQEPGLVGALERRFADADPGVVEASLIAALTLGSAHALEALQGYALDAPRPRPSALALLAALGGPSQHVRIAEQLAVPGRAGSALFALGYSGNLTFVPLLLEQLESQEPSLVKLAAQSLSLVLGIDLQDDALQLPPPRPRSDEDLGREDEDAEARSDLPPLGDDDLDAAALDWPEDALPEPDVPALRRAVDAARAGLDPQRRHLMGRPYAPATVATLLSGGALRRRHTLALVAFIGSAGRSFIHTRACERLQSAQLAASADVLLEARRFPTW